MNKDTIDKKLQEALALHDEGKSYQAIREHFQDELDEATLAYIIRLVDEFALEESRLSQEVKKAKSKIAVGFLAVVLSCYLLLIIDPQEGFLNSTSMYSFYALTAIKYLPLLGALYFMFKAYRKMKYFQRLDPEIDDTKFQMKRSHRSKKGRS